jgi:hypothetical protein
VNKLGKQMKEKSRVQRKYRIMRERRLLIAPIEKQPFLNGHC